LVRNIDDADLLLDPGRPGSGLEALVGDDKQVAAWHRERGVRGRADVGAELQPADQSGFARVADVQDPQAGVPPAAVGTITADERVVVLAVPPSRPVRLLARGDVHAGQ